MNNVVDHGTESLSDTIHKAREIVKVVRRSNNLTYKFMKEQERDGLKSKMLIMDVQTRWNSLYMMLERMVSLERYVRILLTSEAILQEYLIDDDGWTELRLLLEILKPFKLATDYFSSMKLANLGAVIPIYDQLVSMVSAVLESDNQNQTYVRLIGKLKAIIDSRPDTGVCQIAIGTISQVDKRICWVVSNHITVSTHYIYIYTALLDPKPSNSWMSTPAFK